MGQDWPEIHCWEEHEILSVYIQDHSVCYNQFSGRCLLTSSCPGSILRVVIKLVKKASVTLSFITNSFAVC